MSYRRNYKLEWLRRATRPRAKCHPEKAHRARGMCDACYNRWLYANSDAHRKQRLRTGSNWRNRYPERAKFSQRANHLRKRYGIDETQYRQMLAEQDGKCALCLKPKKLHIDHCHDTGVVRGLLCLRCNGSLAWVEEMLRQEKRPWMKRAMEYIENAKKNTKAKN